MILRHLTFFKSISLLILVLCFTHCTNGTDSGGGSGCRPTKIDTIKNGPQPLNISIYLDLSDRLERELTPSQAERDTAIINHIVDIFIKDCVKNGRIIDSKNHLQVFFFPEPDNSEIALLAKGLNVDMAKTDIKEKRTVLSEMKKRFNTNLSQIYADAVSQKKYVGSDIWGFFSNRKVDELCVRKGYRNILVILTDGFLYHEANKISENHAHSYILPQTLADPNSSLIAKRDGLDSLEVLMLEVNPFDQKQHDKQIAVLEQWFKSMGVSKFVVSDTNLPVNTETYIDNFIGSDR